MKFKKLAVPAPSEGISFEGVVDQVVPDQTIKLKEILERFVRKEALPVGHRGTYGSDGSIDPESDSEFNVDVEKARHWDLTERAEFADKVSAARRESEKAEKDRLKKEAADKALRDQKDFDKKVRIAARKMAKNPAKPGSI